MQVDRVRIAPAERRGDGAIRDSLCGFLLTEVELQTCTIRAHIKGTVQTLRDRQQMRLFMRNERMLEVINSEDQKVADSVAREMKILRQPSHGRELSPVNEVLPSRVFGL